jgi:hypothetical protein
MENDVLFSSIAERQEVEVESSSTEFGRGKGSIK